VKYRLTLSIKRASTAAVQVLVFCLVGLWLAGVRIPFPEPLIPNQFELILTEGACFSLIDNAFTINYNFGVNFY